jgi:hypothetical protein
LTGELSEATPVLSWSLTKYSAFLFQLRYCPERQALWLKAMILFILSRA